MQIARVEDRTDAQIRIYDCPACEHEMRLTVWSRRSSLRRAVLPAPANQPIPGTHARAATAMPLFDAEEIRRRYKYVTE
jgi:hypothetical protein